MKTTLDLPADLLHAVETRAVEEKRKLDDTVADILRRGLLEGISVPATSRKRLKLPLVECAHEALPDKEMTPERVANSLLDEWAGSR